VTPRYSLAYWCAVDRRLNELAKFFPDRIMFLDFEEFCRNALKSCRDILAFCGLSAPQSTIEEFANRVQVPESLGRFRGEDAAEFDPSDVDYARSRLRRA
jgi:hypothetical protein